MTITQLVTCCLSIPVTVVFMFGCAGIDRQNGKALGTAGQTAAQSLQGQADAAHKRLEGLPEWWGVRDAFVCANTEQGAPRTECLDKVLVDFKKAPNDPSRAIVQKLATVMANRATAAGALRDAYQAFVNLATYDAAGETETAIQGAFGTINTLSEAVGKLPQAAALPAITSTFTAAAAGVGGIFAEERQRKLMLTASQDLHKATDAMIKALSAEQAAWKSLLKVLQTEQDTLYSSFVQVGLINPRDALAPLLAEIAPNVQMVQTPPPENTDLIKFAALFSVAERSRRQQQAIVASYDASLTALKALSAEHAKLENGQSLNLTTVLAEAQRIQTLLTNLNQGK